MPRLLEREEGIVCRACGATHAPPAREEAPPDICRTCWLRFSSSCSTRGIDPTEDQLNRWLARRLYLNARRLKLYGVIGPCEAISIGAGALYIRGYGSRGGFQCSSAATMFRDGRRVCTSHGDRARNVQYIDIDNVDPYRDFGGLLAELCKIDERLFECVRAAIADTSAQTKG